MNVANLDVLLQTFATLQYIGHYRNSLFWNIDRKGTRAHRFLISTLLYTDKIHWGNNFSIKVIPLIFRSKESTFLIGMDKKG